MRVVVSLIKHIILLQIKAKSIQVSLKILLFKTKWDLEMGIGFDEGCSIYPFLWANECKIDTADKRKVPFEEILNLNFDNCKEFGGK